MIVLKLNNNEKYVLRIIPYLYPNEGEKVSVILINSFDKEIVIDNSLIPQVVGNGYLLFTLPSINIEDELKYKIKITINNDNKDVIYTDEIIFTKQDKYKFKYNKSNDDFLRV